MSHAFLSASGAHRWLNCTASPTLEQGMADSYSVYAQEGTVAHSLGEAILLDDQKAIETIKENDLFYPGMIEEVEQYTNYCLERYNEAKQSDELATMEVEQRLYFDRYVPKGYGTGDCVIVGGDSLEIIDLKFGKGVEVDVVENPQLMLYALGALEAYDYIYKIKKVTMTVAQVRTVGINSYDISANSLREWGEHIAPTAKKAYEGGSEPNPGNWCRFCKYRNDCKPRAEMMKGVYDKYSDKDVLITAEDRSDLLAIVDDIAKWVKDFKADSLEKALQGDYIPGWKIVEGRSNRKIVDEEGLAETLLGKGFSEDEIYKPKTIQTITKLEKLLGKKEFAELGEPYINKPSGKPTLVVETDKRPAINDVENDFEFN